jgi:hypothetical protein
MSQLARTVASEHRTLPQRLTIYWDCKDPRSAGRRPEPRQQAAVFVTFMVAGSTQDKRATLWVLRAPGPSRGCSRWPIVSA